MNHDEFVGQVQHRAHLPSRGDAELIIRATLETLGERLQSESAEHVAAQLPPELGRHLKNRPFEHLSLRDFNERVAKREHHDIAKASFHARCGPGLLVDAGGSARMFNSAISGGTSDPVHVVTGGVLDLQDGNTLSGAAVQVACDDWAVLFGSGSDVKTSCKKTK